MHFCFLTRTLSPGICGIGDQSVILAEHLRNRGHQASLIGGAGDSEPHRRIVKEFWTAPHLPELRRQLDDLAIDHLVLQFTPLMYSVNRLHQNRRFAHFWGQCSKCWRTSIIVHETYFQEWSHPFSLIRGAFEKAALKRVVSGAHHAFTASQPLRDEMARWRVASCVQLLPIGSAVPKAAADGARVRIAHGVAEDAVVLTLFGGGAGLRHFAHLVNALDATLAQQGVRVCWLLLGGVPADWFKLRQPTLVPGYVSREALSAFLRISDIFLMPHINGISAKRSTLMAALEHGLPVVGTRGPMTDGFWSELPGVQQVSPDSPDAFADAVTGLCRDADRRARWGASNAEYFTKRFAWPLIADKLLATVQG